MRTQDLITKALRIEKEIKKIIRLLKVGKLKSYLLSGISKKGEVNLLGVVGLVYLTGLLIVLLSIF